MARIKRFTSWSTALAALAASTARPKSSVQISKPVITDLIAGQFNDPVRVVAFNTLKHWARDVSKDIARRNPESVRYGWRRLPEALQDFFDSYVGPDRQLALRLA
jgi:hypothetical protein